MNLISTERVELSQTVMKELKPMDNWAGQFEKRCASKYLSFLSFWNYRETNWKEQNWISSKVSL